MTKVQRIQQQDILQYMYIAISYHNDCSIDETFYLIVISSIAS